MGIMNGSMNVMWPPDPFSFVAGGVAAVLVIAVLVAWNLLMEGDYD